MTQNAESTPSDGDEPSSQTAVDDLVLVSNRQPYRHTYDDGDVTAESPVGGLTAGLDPVMQRLEGTWIAWGDGEADQEASDESGRVAVPPDDPAYTLERIALSEAEVSGYYEGYANQALWPLCHTVPSKAQFRRDHWKFYRRVNREFADAIVEHVEPGTTVWFQDYHFTLAPRAVRERAPEAFLSHFLHIPWPAADVFRVCPDREAILRGLLGNDVLGFHLPGYSRNFLDCVEAFVQDATVDRNAGRVHHDGHMTDVQAFPLGVDAADVRERSESANGTFVHRFRRTHGIDPDTRLALGVDRLDYTKGIPERLAALERLWETRPELRGEFTYVQKGMESRENVPAYQRLQDTVESAVDRINDRFETEDWQPVVSTTAFVDYTDLCSLYRHSDLAIVTPLRDGMNLVAKEYVAAQVEDDGVLVLSRMAGAHDQLGDRAVTVDPYDVESGAAAIERALTMDEEERKTRMRSLRHQVHEADLSAWLDDVLAMADRVRRRKSGVVAP